MIDKSMIEALRRPLFAVSRSGGPPQNSDVIPDPEAAAYNRAIDDVLALFDDETEAQRHAPT